MKRSIFAKVALILGLTAAWAPAGLFDEWERTLILTYTNCPAGESLTSFPTLVVLGAQIESFRYYQFKSGINADLRFTDVTGSQELNYEIDEWDESGSSHVWVQIPVLTNGTRIVAHWGKEGVSASACTTNGAVWSAGYAGVWHMNQIDTPDSSTNGNDGLAQLSPTIDEGLVGNSVNTASGYVSATNAANLEITNALTLSVWVRASSGIANAGILHKGVLSGSQPVYGITVESDMPRFKLNSNGHILTGTTPLDTNGWHYLCATYNRVNTKLYKNGQLDAQGSYSAPLSMIDAPLFIGTYYTGSYRFPGRIDEVRVENVARSSNWIEATYMTMASNNVFTGYGAVGGGVNFVSWRSRMDITFTNVPEGEVLHNFPVLVKLGTHIEGFSYDHFESGVHADLRFTDNTGEELSYEVDEWNPSGSSFVWARVPVLTNGTAIVAYWGKGGQSEPAYTTNGAVWSAGYAGVWHMNQIDTPDSSTNGNDGLAQLSPTVDEGLVGNSVNTASGYVSATNAANLEITNALTLSVWVRTSSGIANAGILHKGVLSASQPVYGIIVYSDMPQFRLNSNGHILTGTTPLDTSGWHYLCATYNRVNTKLYKNGQLDAQGSYSAPLSMIDAPLFIGTYYTGSYRFPGRIDEVRVENVARSSNWIEATYMTMASNAVFQTYGEIDRQALGTILLIR